jgi:hypothetical protein
MGTLKLLVDKHSSRHSAWMVLLGSQTAHGGIPVYGPAAKDYAKWRHNLALGGRIRSIQPPPGRKGRIQ